jgi:hypothetical protein
MARTVANSVHSGQGLAACPVFLAQVGANDALENNPIELESAGGGQFLGQAASVFFALAGSPRLGRVSARPQSAGAFFGIRHRLDIELPKSTTLVKS